MGNILPGNIELLSQPGDQMEAITFPPGIEVSFRKPKTGTVLRSRCLPGWPEGKRGAPNEILQSSLFTAKNRNQPRPYLNDVDAVVVGEGRIRYRGEELRQDDELVWLNLVHLSRGVPLGECMEFTPYSFLKDMSWPTSGQSYRRLRTCILRMVATTLQVSTKRMPHPIVLSMVKRAELGIPDSSVHLKNWRIWISPEIQMLFEEDAFSLIDLAQRVALPEGIASKLHSYWSSQGAPFPVRVETLLRLCGSGMIPKHFKFQLVDALSKLKEVGFLKGWDITGNLVVVQREKGV